MVGPEAISRNSGFILWTFQSSFGLPLSSHIREKRYVGPLLLRFLHFIFAHSWTYSWQKWKVQRTLFYLNLSDTFNPIAIKLNWHLSHLTNPGDVRDRMEKEEKEQTSYRCPLNFSYGMPWDFLSLFIFKQLLPPLCKKPPKIKFRSFHKLFFHCRPLKYCFIYKMSDTVLSRMKGTERKELELHSALKEPTVQSTREGKVTDDGKQSRKW